MSTPNVWVAKDDGSDIVRAEAIASVGRDYNGNVTVRLAGGEALAVTLVAVAPHEGKHTPEDFHRQLIRIMSQLSDTSDSTVVYPVWDKQNGWHWITAGL
ncbi:MAG: hypothetical protein ACLPKI_09285 [Streptosporangiaceae bacterium]